MRTMDAIAQEKKQMSLQEIADLVEGRLVGDGSIIITGVAGVEDASEGDIVFVETAKFYERALKSPASALIVSESVMPNGRACIVTKDPRLAFVKVLEKFASPRPHKPGVHPTAVIASSAKLAEGVSVGPYAVVEEEASIGRDTVVGAFCFIGPRVAVAEECVLHSMVCLHEGTTVERCCQIHPGTVVGADGFGYVWDNGHHRKIPQTGSVRICEGVEIGANVCIDRATFGATRIGAGSKIDNQVQIAHNVIIGRNCIICAQTGISGSTTIGDGVVLGGQVGVGDHIAIGDGVTVGAQGGVISDLAPGAVVSGYPAGPHREKMKVEAAIRRVPDLLKRVRELEKELEELRASLNQR